jgi:hypothetical protein
VEEELLKTLLQKAQWQLVWARHAEKVALALDMVNATLNWGSVTVTKVGMELFVTPSIVKAGMEHWDRTALAMGFAMQENVNVPKVGVRTHTQKTRQLQMCARIRFVQ